MHFDEQSEKIQECSEPSGYIYQKTKISIKTLGHLTNLARCVNILIVYGNTNYLNK